MQKKIRLRALGCIFAVAVSLCWPSNFKAKILKKSEKTCTAILVPATAVACGTLVVIFLKYKQSKHEPAKLACFVTDDNVQQEVSIPLKEKGTLKTGQFFEGNSLNKHQITSVTIPNSVKQISHGAFDGCVNLKSVKFTNDSKVESIENFAFRGTGIESVIVPRSVKRIGVSAFSNCLNLASVTFEQGSKITAIDAFAFYGTNIKKIIIPASIKEMGVGIFQNCRCLNFVMFCEPSQLERLSAQTFTGTAIENIFIPSSVREIADAAFSGCPNLKNVTFSPNSNISKIGARAFSDCTSLGNVNLPSNVEVDPSAFSGTPLDKSTKSEKGGEEEECSWGSY